MFDLTKRVGNNIREIRKSQNLTIDEFAEKCDFQAPYLSNVERGERNITLQTLEKLIIALNVNPGEILIPGITKITEDRSIRDELIYILLDSLENKDEDDIRMLLNVSNEIYKTYKKE